MAKANPDQDFIGVEVYRVGVGSLLADLEEHALTNVRVFCADVVEVLEQAIPDGSVDRIQLFFPDPWPKKRHHKRRLVQDAFVEKIADKLQAGGVFHMATDWHAYADHMLKVMSNSPRFSNHAGLGQFAQRPAYRCLTKYEQRGQALGHGVWDLIFTLEKIAEY
jgi:tRNA (guanine-N7-)-methyltransferase